MDIKKALQIKTGTMVHYPADRGSPAGCAKAVQDVTHSGEYSTTFDGKPYVLVNLGSHGCWPSTRL